MINREQALALPGIGKALADKIMEMLENGRIRKVFPLLPLLANFLTR